MTALPRITDEWIVARRGPRAAIDVRQPYAWLIEPERTRAGALEDVATVFISNRECPFRCLMCDLWKHTTIDRTPEGAVAEQVAWALRQMPKPRHIKLYNAGNFFDVQAIPRRDRDEVARLVSGHETVIVECHPRLVGRESFEFAGRLRGRLEVAMGLETIDPAVMAILNKRMTLSHYADAARRLTDAGIGVRAFILLRGPTQSEAAGIEWARRSIEWAFDTGVECCAIIPTRAGNGAMDELAARGAFEPPRVDSLLAVLEHGVSLGIGRVFADLWDVRNRPGLTAADRSLIARMQHINDMQSLTDAPVVQAAGAQA